MLSLLAITLYSGAGKSSNAEFIGALVVLALFTLVTGVVIALYVRRIGRVSLMDEHPLTQRLRFSSAEPSTSMALIAEESLKSMGVRSVSRQIHSVVGTTPMSRRSYGQVIEVLIEQRNDSSSICTCRSWPKVSYTIKDWGAGQMALDRFFEAVKERDPQAELLS